MGSGWTREEVDAKLRNIMKNIHDASLAAAKEYGKPGNYMIGANIAGFIKVCECHESSGRYITFVYHQRLKARDLRAFLFMYLSKTNHMLITTTNSIEGKRIVEYYGLVSGETIIGANIVKDLFASITDIVGGRSSVYEKTLREAKETAVAEMSEEAQRKGANAVIGVDLDYETLGSGGSMLMVTACGTAVRLE